MSLILVKSIMRLESYCINGNHFNRPCRKFNILTIFFYCSFLLLQTREDYYAGLQDRYFLSIEKAKDQKFLIDFDSVPPVTTPKKLGITSIDYVSLEDIVPYID